MSNEVFREAALAMRSRNGFDAKMVSFRKGSWSSGKDGADMDGAELIALVHDLMVGWTKWLDRRPADYRLGFIRDRYRPPMRGDLGDNDSALWERRNREAVDPWEFSFYLPLFDAAAGQTYISRPRPKAAKTASPTCRKPTRTTARPASNRSSSSRATATTIAHTAKSRRRGSRSSDGSMRRTSRSSLPQRRR